MANSITFLNQTLTDVTKEEEYLKDVLNKVHAAQEYVVNQEHSLKTVEAIILRLKEKITEFAYRKFPLLMGLLANPQRTYTKEIDDILLMYTEIKVDIGLLGKFIETIKTRTHEEAWNKISEESQFLNLLTEEHRQVIDTMNTFDGQIGWNWAIDLPHFDWNVKEKGLQQCMQTVKEKIAEQFKKKYGFIKY
jgi:hypothetical protein